jgi:hypothetical protein
MKKIITLFDKKGKVLKRYVINCTPETTNDQIMKQVKANDEYPWKKVDPKRTTIENKDGNYNYFTKQAIYTGEYGINNIGKIRRNIQVGPKCNIFK